MNFSNSTITLLYEEIMFQLWMVSERTPVCSTEESYYALRICEVKGMMLLLSMCGSQTRSTQTEVHTGSQSTGAAAAAAVTTQLDVSAELRELRDMVEIGRAHV